MKRCIECHKTCTDEDAKIWENVPDIDEDGKWDGSRVMKCVGEACPECGAIVEDYTPKPNFPLATTQVLTTIEQRKLEYILKEAKLTMEDVDTRFKRIDRRIAQIQAGTVMYEADCWGDFFKQEVTAIKDKDNGIITVVEPGYPVGKGQPPMQRDMSCLSFYFRPEYDYAGKYDPDTMEVKSDGTTHI